MLSRPFLSRIPDQSMILTQQKDDENYVIATRDENGSYAMIYFPTGRQTKIDFSKLNGQTLNVWWFDPRTGHAFKGLAIDKIDNRTITPPTSGKGNDWVLVADSSQDNFDAPGAVPN